MPRSGITLQDVQGAIDALESEGTKPTVKSIQERLGTGSTQTVSRHLSTIQAARSVGVKPQATAPKDLAREFEALFERLWQSAMAVASEENRQLKQAVTEKAGVIRTDLQRMMHEAAQLEADVNALSDIARKEPDDSSGDSKSSSSS